jgi:hypothetical protein
MKSTARALYFLHFLCAAVAGTPLVAQASSAEEASGFVVPSGQEDLVERILNVEPAEAGRWWFHSAEIPGAEIRARFELLDPADPRLGGADPEADRAPGETLVIRLLHPSVAPQGCAVTDRFALARDPSSGSVCEIPGALAVALLRNLDEHQEDFVWRSTGGGTSAGVTARRTGASTGGHWGRSTLLALTMLGLFAAGRFVLLRRRKAGVKPAAE